MRRKIYKKNYILLLGGSGQLGKNILKSKKFKKIHFPKKKDLNLLLTSKPPFFEVLVFDPVVDEDFRHMHRLAKSMSILLEPDERELKPISLIDKRLKNLAMFLDKVSNESDKIVNCRVSI